MIVSLKNVYLAYGQRNVLSDVSFDLPHGAFVFLTGPSGAGKSSLLRLITMTEENSSGKINLFGKPIENITRSEKASLRRRMGVIYQDFRLIPHLTALENAALPLRLAGGNESQIRTHVSELLSWVGLGNRLDAFPAELSGGEQQRVAIARAIVNKPALLLADEPTGNVDETTAMKLLHLLGELNKMGTAVIFATHQPNLVDYMRKPVMTLRKGFLTFDKEASL